jgi:hypothetical protein
MKNIKRLTICGEDSTTLMLIQDVKVKVSPSMCLINSAARHQDILGTRYIALEV